jgi:ribonucleotide reductase alpha subunit
MVCLDMDHPDIEDFINWKVREEIKVAALVEGLKKKLNARDQRDLRPKLGLKLDYDFNGEAYAPSAARTATTRCASPIRSSTRVDKGASGRPHWRTTARSPGRFKARELWDEICYAAWRCADPACSSTRRSTPGTPARRGAHQRQQPVQRVHVPRQHGVQPGVAQRAEVLRLRDAHV